MRPVAARALSQLCTRRSNGQRGLKRISVFVQCVCVGEKELRTVTRVMDLHVYVYVYKNTKYTKYIKYTKYELWKFDI